MYQEVNISLSPDDWGNESRIQQRICNALSVNKNSISGYKLLRRSVDARKRPPVFQLRMGVWINEPKPEEIAPNIDWQNVTHKPPVYIIGLGPGGLFAALRLIQQGIKPIIIERGKDVRARRRDLALLNREGIVNPESNYCFGEGGAGTFSDGKLYTRSTKRGDTLTVLQLLTYFGANPDILIDAHPHIGTNKLPQIIQNMSEHIVSCGGEIRFNTCLTDIEVAGGKLKSITVNHNEKIQTDALILATGHSARDIYELLYKRNVLIEAKPFALGVRVEHPQAIIDQIQYHCDIRHPQLPAASYALVKQVEAKGVYSFCMCPGGIICPATTADQELVVNGWSPSKRDSPFANSGMVVEIAVADYHSKHTPLDGIEFQRSIEALAFTAGGGKQVAPAQRLVDFVKGRLSTNLPECSYLPGINSVQMGEVLPAFVHKRLQEGFKQFGQMMKGYLTQEAVAVGVESRTSSPVRIPRDADTYMHPQVIGLYPCGEGAGYAGGIMSAAIDGQKCADKSAAHIHSLFPN